jgi:hypothetical protein
MEFRALALAAVAGALLAAGCASTPGAAPPTGPERFVAKVQAAGFGNKDLAPLTSAQLRQVGRQACSGLATGIPYRDNVRWLVASVRKPSTHQAAVLVAEAIRNLCPQFAKQLPPNAP